MTKLEHYHFAAPSKLMYLGIEYQQLLTSQKRDKQKLCALIKEHKGIQHESDQVSGSSCQFVGNQRAEEHVDLPCGKFYVWVNDSRFFNGCTIRERNR